MNPETITCSCPQCGRPFRVPAQLQGKKIQCKGCQTQFVVQASKPATAAPPLKTAQAPAAPAAAPAAAGSVPVTAATAAPAPVAPPSDGLALIPFDEGAVPVPPDGADGGVSQTVSTRGKQMEKVKIESSGPYFVVKLVLTGKMIHVGLERTLNEYAAEGWYLEQILPVGSDAYAILKREQDGKKGQPSGAKEPDSQEVDVKTL
jgi:hypothetical protein